MRLKIGQLALAFLTTGIAVNAAQLDCGKTLERYSGAYSGMDIKALGNLTVPLLREQLKNELAQFKQRKEQPQFKIIYLYQKECGKNAFMAEGLSSLQVNGQYRYRNELTEYALKDGRLTGIKALFNPDVPAYFWTAALHSGKIGVLESKNRGQELKIVSFLPDATFSGKQPKIPLWVLYQVRMPGRYLIPLKQTAAGYEIPGSGYAVPAVNVSEQSKYAGVITDYRLLAPEQEETFLKKLIKDEAFASLQLASLRRLAAMGEFQRPLSKDAMQYWTEVYLSRKQPVQFRRYLLTTLARVNFLPDSPIFIDALKDQDTCRMAGEIFCRKDKKRFEALMQEWLKDPQLRTCSLKNGILLTDSPEYVAAAIKYFDLKKKDNLELYLPLFCASNNSKTQTLVKEFLSRPVTSVNYVQYYTVIQLLCRGIYMPDYADDFKQFLKTNKDNQLVRQSVIYPTALAGLCKAGDAEGCKLALGYIATLKPESTLPIDAAKVRVFLTAFRNYNSRFNKPEEYKQALEAQLAKQAKAQAIADKKKKK